MMPSRWSRSVVLSMIVAGALVAPVAAQAPPPVPTAPTPPDLPAGDVERFALTVDGYQLDKLAFAFNATPGQPCPFMADGSVQEFWEFKRGRRVVMEFRRLAPGVAVVGRVGRAPGDAAFATQGRLQRRVTGFVQLASAVACPTLPLTTPACDRSYDAPADLKLNYARGRLSLVSADTENTSPNPAVACGHSPRLNFGDELSWEHPVSNAQSVRLPLRRIFDSRRSLRLVLKSSFLQGTEAPESYTKYEETLQGRTTVTLTRLRSR